MAECVEQYHRRRALGEPARPEDWKERLGDHYQEFTEILTAASAIDDLIEPPISEENFPRTYGEYTLLRILGRGSMGIVYEAVHRGLGRKVALKVLRSGFDDEPLALERFQREARACAQIRHDHVIPIYEAGIADDRPYYAMPHVRGRSLLDLVRVGKVPQRDELCRSLANIADALQALHETGIVHRDVKPGNIMVEPDGKMILSDFGLARTAEAQTLTQTGQALGTPLYMSPEQLLGHPDEIDGRTDVYGLGVTLYEALAGRPPFHSDRVTRLMRMIIMERPPSLREVAPETPVECSHIVMKAIEKEQKDRYQTAGELRDDLIAFSEGRPVHGRPVSPLRRAVRRSRRLFLPVLALIAVLCGIGYLLWARDAELVIASFPNATITVNGEVVGQTPRRIELSAGRHRIELTAPGCTPRVEELDLAHGERRTMELLLFDPNDPRALDWFAAKVDVQLRTYLMSENLRSGSAGAPVEVGLPAGDVRLADLGAWQVIVDPMIDLDGTIEFRRGDEVLFRERFEPERVLHIGMLPDRVVSALGVGDLVRWGYFPRTGEPVTRQFRVVEDEVAPRIRAIEEGLGDVPSIVVRQLEAQVLLDAGLSTGAFAVAARIQEEHPENARALGIKLQALRDAGLSRSRMAERVHGAIVGLSGEAREGVFRER